MKPWIGAIAIAGSAILMAGPQYAYAQASQTFMSAVGRAELAELSPHVRAEVETRLKQPGQNVPEILQTMLLNNIKAKYPGGQIVALDFGRGVVVVQTTDNHKELVQFDTHTLAIKA